MLNLKDGLVFVGTRGLATRCLLFIIETCGKDIVSAIIGASRHEKPWWSGEAREELWHVADRHGIRYFEAMETVSHRGGFLVSVIWPQIFSVDLLTRFDQGGINLHPAPLPSYRGSFTRTHAILNCERSFGVTVHWLSERADRGDIVGEMEFPVLPLETALSLETRAQHYGYALFCQTWLRLLDGSCTRISQSALIAEGKRKPRFYSKRMMTALLESKHVPRTHEQLELLHRALFLPPRIMPPKWLLEVLRTNGEV